MVHFFEFVHGYNNQTYGRYTDPEKDISPHLRHNVALQPAFQAVYLANRVTFTPAIYSLKYNVAHYSLQLGIAALMLRVLDIDWPQKALAGYDSPRDAAADLFFASSELGRKGFVLLAALDLERTPFARKGEVEAEHMAFRDGVSHCLMLADAFSRATFSLPLASVCISLLAPTAGIE